jgi:SAM-dependent methyltransferase
MTTAAEVPVLTRRGPAQALSPAQHAFRRVVLAKLESGLYSLESVERCRCGSDAAQKLLAGDRFGLPIGVVACRTCGLVRTSPRLAPQCLPDFYRDDYHGLHFGIPDPDPAQALFRVGQGQIVFGAVRPFLSGTYLRVAEIGCGSGTVLREFERAASAAGVTVLATGCEYSPAYVAAGRRFGTDIRLGGVDALQGIEPADLVILSHVVEHFADLDAEIAMVKAITHPTALLYVEVPGLLTIHRKPEYNYSLSEYVTLAHNYHFTLATLTDVLLSAGLRPVSGDEVVRGVFRRSPNAGQAPDATGRTARYAATLAYLTWLERSRSMAVRRFILAARRRIRRIVGTAARWVLGDRVVDAARRAIRRLNRHGS